MTWFEIGIRLLSLIGLSFAVVHFHAHRPVAFMFTLALWLALAVATGVYVGIVDFTGRL